MKKLKRVFGSVANLTSGRGGDDASSAEPPLSIPLSTSRKSISGSVQGLSTHRGSYVSYESQSLDSYNSAVSADVDPFSKQDKNFTKLHKWAYLGDVVKLKKFIRKIPVDAQDSEGKTALHHAAAQGRGDALLFLLGSKGNVEVKDSNGMTPFLRAVERCQLPIIQMLLQRRVDARVTDCQGNNSCHLAAKAGAAELLSLLLDCGSDCDAQNSLGRTPLHLACGENQQDAVEILLRRGASVNITDKEGVTPLMAAAKVGSAPLVETLLEHGADVSPIDSSKWSAADYARFTNHNQLHHRLSSLMEKGESSGLFSDDLLNVSDEGTSHDEGAVGFSPKAKPSDNEAAVDSWSDNSDVNSIKEKPKLNLAKFLPSSDESADNVFSNAPEVSTVESGPPKPPRLYTSSSSLASIAAEENEDDIHAEDNKVLAKEDKESLKEDDSWKSSSEDEPRMPLFSLPRKRSDTLIEVREEEETVNNSNGSESRTKLRNTDLMAELGLGNIDYHSSEEVSFDEEDAVLPVGEAQKEATHSRQNSQPMAAIGKGNEPFLTAESVGQDDPVLPESPIHSSRSSTKTSKQSPKESKERLNADSPLCISPALSGGSRNRTPMNLSPRKSPARKSPKKLKSRERKLSNFDSDTDDEVSIPKRPARRKSATPTKKKKENLPTKESASDESDWEKEEDDLSPRSPSSKGISRSAISKNIKNSSPEKYQDSKNDSANSKGLLGKLSHDKGSNSDINKLSVFAGNNEKSRSNTLSTVVGTLGREGTMQELEEMWEANPSISPKRSSSSSSIQNSEDFPKPLIDLSDVPDAGKVSLKPKEESVSGSTTKRPKIEKAKGKKEILDTENTVKDDDYISDDDIDPVLADNSQSDIKKSLSSPKYMTSNIGTTKKLSEGKSHTQVDSVPLESKVCASNVNENSEKNRVSKSDKGSKDHNGIMPRGHSLVSTSHSRRGSKTGTGRTSGFGSIIFSDDDSLIQDPLTTPRLMDDIDDGISAASTETEESAHINSGLKDSLLTPLSSLPDANDINQLQDLIRELRLKLEKEFGRRAAMETRYSQLQQQEKLCRLQNDQLEQDVQRLHQEITSLTARIKQLEYLGHCEQDSSRLKDQSLEEYQVHCAQIEEQYGSLRTHAMQQEQLVESLMFQLQTKERVNQSLQEKLEDISSQTKYVSMKSCQTEEVFVAAMQEGSEHVIGIDVSLQTCCDSPEMVTTGLQTDDNQKDSAPLKAEVDCPNCHNMKKGISCETKVVAVQTELENEHKIKEVAVNSSSTQSEKVESHETQSIGIQFSPEKEMKGCQTQKNIQSHHAQTDMSSNNCDIVYKRTVSDSGCQVSYFGRLAATQTDSFVPVTDMQPLETRETKNLSTADITLALEPVLQNLTQDVKTLVMEASDANHNSLQELMNQLITTQLENLKGGMEVSLQEKSAQQSQETELKFNEWIHRLEDILRGQVDIVTEMCNNAAKTDKNSDVHDVLAQVNNDLESKFQNFKCEVDDLQKKQGQSEEKLVSHMETVMKNIKESNDKIMKCLNDLQTENKDSDHETYEKLHQLTSPQFKELYTAIQTIKHTKDDGLFEVHVKDMFTRLDYLEKSLMSAFQKSYASQDISFIEDELHKFNDSILKKLTLLQNSIQTVDSDGRISQDTLDSYMNTLKDSNKQLIHILKTKTSESTTNINEAIEENFHILQDHLRKIQQSLMQRINEVSQQANIAEDQKMSWISKQMTEMASQVSGMQTNLMRMQSSFEAAQNLPAVGSILDETLISSLRASNEQAVTTLKFQNQSVIQLLESLQKEVQSSIQKSTPAVKDSAEIHMLKETLSEKEEELRRLRSSQESLQEKLRSQCLSLDRSQHKEEELRLKIDSLSEKLHHLQEDLKERDEKISHGKIKSSNQIEETSKLRQENLHLITENSKISSFLSAEQQQRQWYEGELQRQKDAREGAETKVQELLMQLQMTHQQIPLQRTPPTGRDKDDDTIILKQQEIEKLQLNLKESEKQYNEQLSRAQRLELQLREVEADLGLEKASKEDLAKDLKKSKETVSKFQIDLSDALRERGTLQELQSCKEELEAELKANEMAMDTFRKKLESVNKEKLQLKQDIMLLKGEKLSFDLIKQEKDLAEEMQRKTETQLQLLQKRISIDYVPKSKINQLYKELENKYQLELSAKISELSKLMEVQTQHQESQAKAKESREQGLKNELSKLSEEVIRLRAMLSVREEEDDTWKTRHNRLMNLYQQQAQTYNSIHKSPHPKKSADESLSASLREIEAHLQTPYATSTLLGQLTPPSSLQPLPKMPSNIDSYHYTHCDSLDRTLQKYLLKGVDNDHSRYMSPSDDKPHARISPMQPSHVPHDALPTLDKSCEDYVDLLKKKYGL